MALLVFPRPPANCDISMVGLAAFTMSCLGAVALIAVALSDGAKPASSEEINQALRAGADISSEQWADCANQRARRVPANADNAARLRALSRSPISRADAQRYLAIADNCHHIIQSHREKQAPSTHPGRPPARP